MSERFVIDASVAAKWFINDGVDTDLAEDVLLQILSGDIESHAPQLFAYEVCAVFKKYFPRHLTTLTLLLKAANDLLEIPVTHVSRTDEELVSALRLAAETSRGYYDMCYVHLAEKLSCEWLTADGKVLTGPPPNFPTNRVKLLSSLR